MSAACKVGCKVVLVFHCCLHPKAAGCYFELMPTKMGDFSVEINYLHLTFLPAL